MRQALFVTLSGPSGIGKSTVLRQLISRQTEFGLTLTLPSKLTTRPPKPTDSADEMSYISTTDFFDLEQRGALLMAFERHGHRYGLQIPVAIPKQTILIQAMPSAIATQLKQI